MKHQFILILLFFSGLAEAKTKVDVPDFTDKTKANSCRAVTPWARDIGFAFKQQLVTALNSSGRFTVLEAELLRGESRDSIDEPDVSALHKKRTFKATNFSLVGQLKVFNLCDTKKGHSAKVEIEVQVIDVNTGDIVKRLNGAVSVNKAGNMDRGFMGASFNSGLFKDSAIGEATHRAITEVAAKIVKALPDRDVASNNEYKVQTIRRPHSR